jgi:mxaL protein
VLVVQKHFRTHYEMIALFTALLLLILAAMKPTLPFKQEIKNYLILVDVTQSMNVSDMSLQGHPASRLEFTKALLKQTIKDIPCHSRVGLGIFFKADIVLLYTPIEICSNTSLIWDSIDHLEWRMASRGNSNIRLGLQSISARLATFDTPTNVVFITDGDEAPPLNAITKTKIAGWVGNTDLLLVGLGKAKASPIPKLDANNNPVGYWSIYSIKMAPGVAVNEGPNDARDESYASAPYEYYMSRLDEAYMTELATDTDSTYLKATDANSLLRAMLNLKVSYHDQIKLDISWLLAIGALLCVLSLFIWELPKIFHKFSKQLNKKLNYTNLYTLFKK